MSGAVDDHHRAAAGTAFDARVNAVEATDEVRLQNFKRRPRGDDPAVGNCDGRAAASHDLVQVMERQDGHGAGFLHIISQDLQHLILAK